MKENSFILKKANPNSLKEWQREATVFSQSWSMKCHFTSGLSLILSLITDTDYADDLVLLANTPAQAKSLPYSMELAARGIGLYVNSDKTEFM